MKLRTVCAAAVVALTTAFGTVAVNAATPKDMAVIVWQLDELITLDPAEAYEFSGAELAANLYDRLVFYNIDNTDDIQGGIAESWSVSDDGKTFTFKIRDGMTFHSGNPVTAEDAAWSLQRVVKLNKGPAFILSEFGLTADNVDQKVRATDARTLVFETDKPYAESFVLNCLGSWVSSVLDRQTVMQHEKDGDFGNGWLKTNAAGSGPFKLNTWKPNELVMLDRFDGYWRGPAKMKRVALRHIPESAPQRLLLEKGDADIARNLGPDDIDQLAKNADIGLRKVPQGAIYYLGLNQKNEQLAKPQVAEALKWLIDYDSIETNILRGTKVQHQSFLPAGFLGDIEDKPYRYDLDKAKALLAEAGVGDGFKVTMDVRNTYPTADVAQAIQAMWAKAGIDLEIIPGDNKQTLTKYRARQHDIYIGRWAPDYLDPHSNAQGFAWNPNNADDSDFKLLAWRNAWDIPDLTRRTDEALAESDTARRSALYEEMQREHQKASPFVIMFQDIAVVAERKGVSGFEVGPNFDVVYYRNISKE
ncbi:ABC transporter substrate-binding protein [Caenispirillum bisanense]|uniref:ABC transporter substrate-binding protein n=1 Tax=Caenispirillum bisanense TaxID=414052 RepID=UPI0031D22D9C